MDFEDFDELYEAFDADGADENGDAAFNGAIPADHMEEDDDDDNQVYDFDDDLVNGPARPLGPNPLQQLLQGEEDLEAHDLHNMANPVQALASGDQATSLPRRPLRGTWRTSPTACDITVAPCDGGRRLQKSFCRPTNRP